MMTDLRKSIMVDVNHLMEEKMNQSMKAMAVSIRSNVVDSMNIHKTINIQTNLTQLSQPEPITQDFPNTTLQVEDLNSLIEEMDVEKTPNKRKPLTPLTETENQDDTYEDANKTTSDSTQKIEIESPLERRD